MTHDNPSMDGFFAVADWEHHRQAWMAWPTDPDEVPVSLLEAQVCLAEIARVVSRFERVSIIAEPEHAAEAKIAVGPDIDVVPGPVAHAAIRDLGPTFLMQEDGTVKGVAWQFNGWGGRRIVHGADREFSEAVLRATGHPGYHGPLVLEGGAVISDGLGTVIASEQNLLAANRNPLVSRRDVERILMDFYGAAKIIWLGDGISGLIGGGHVSRFARFVRPGVIALHLPEDPEHSDFLAMHENRQRLREATDPFGRSFEIIELPVPESEGLATPSYAGYYLTNGAVVQPVFDDPADQDALKTVGGLYPDREIVPVRAYAISGAVHHMVLGDPDPAPAQS